MPDPGITRAAQPDNLESLQESLRATWEQQNLFAKIIEHFPYPLEIYDRDGTVIMVNRAMLSSLGSPDINMVVGKYNLFKDPDILEKGLLDAAKEVMQGRTAVMTNVKVPIESLRERYKTGKLNIDIMYQDITAFPIFNEQGEVTHGAVMLINRKAYKGKTSVVNAIEYLENNWSNEYDLNATAAAADLSPYHFSRVFKNETGFTPYNYYQKIKIEHLKERLRDRRLTVKEAFHSCGMEYTGHSFGVFKKFTGYTPLQYRELNSK